MHPPTQCQRDPVTAFIYLLMQLLVLIRICAGRSRFELMTSIDRGCGAKFATSILGGPDLTEQLSAVFCSIKDLGNILRAGPDQQVEIAKKMKKASQIGMERSR
jgi:hypothetical protein